MAIVLDGTSGLTTNSGTVISASTIGVGGTTPSTSGSGITFPATQSASTNANTLDDYEEGTWTPTVTANGGTATTYTYSTATYTKTGRMVVVLGDITPTNGTLGSTNGYIRMTGLPFTIGGSNLAVGSGMNSDFVFGGISVVIGYSTTLEAQFISSSANNQKYSFEATYFV
jgi:hypothetical protein